jgi:putative flippase GtrA
MRYSSGNMDTFRDHSVISILALISGLALIPFAPTVGASPSLIASIVPLLLIIENGALAIARRTTLHNLTNFVRYGANGLFNTAIDMCFVLIFSLATGIYAGWTLAAFNAASFIAVNTLSFFVNRTWVFSMRSSARLSEFISFAFVLGSSLVLNSALLFFITTIVDRGTFSESEWLVLAKTIAIVVCLLWNFAFFRLFVFRERLHTQETA